MQQKSLLLIDDDQDLSSLLSEYLSPQGYQITIANDGLGGLELATSGQHFDLILLDVMLPGLDGFEVLKKLRITHLTPVLMLTAKGDDFERIFGLELGADDYLAKPFNHRELSARVKAIVRRVDYMTNAEQIQSVQVGEVAVLPATQEVTCADQKVELTGTEFAILRLLMVNKGHLVNKHEISEKVLSRRLAPFDRSIDMHVSNIRKKLAQHSPLEKIKTVRGAGYIFMVPG